MIPSTCVLTCPTRRSSKRTSPVSAMGTATFWRSTLTVLTSPPSTRLARRAHEAHLVATLVALEGLLLVLAGEGEELLHRPVEIRRLLRLGALLVALAFVRAGVPVLIRRRPGSRVALGRGCSSCTTGFAHRSSSARP